MSSSINAHTTHAHARIHAPAHTRICPHAPTQVAVMMGGTSKEWGALTHDGGPLYDQFLLGWETYSTQTFVETNGLDASGESAGR